MSKYLIIFLIFCTSILAACSKTDQKIENSQGMINLERNLSYSDKVLLKSRNNEDPEICNEVDERDAVQCLMNVYTNVAVNKNDSTVCNELEPSFRFNCVTSIAIALKNQTLCETIGIDSLLYRCKELTVKQTAIADNDTSICNEFEFQGNKYLDSQVPRVRCIEQAAFCNMNENLCENSYCKDRVEQIKAKGNTNGYICDLRQSI